MSLKLYEMRATFSFPFALMGLFLLTVCPVMGQQTEPGNTQKDVPSPTVVQEEGEAPLLYKFEPNYTHAQDERRTAFLARKALIDSLRIPAKKRERLLRELYRGEDKLFNKLMVADTEFEDGVD
ncbi:MAG: hypothetical protein AB3N16_07105 [Flavobacteriaceae bacterium]